MSERYEYITDPSGMAELAVPWDELAAGDPTPFASHAWFASWWEAFGDGPLRIGTLWRDGELAAVLPMRARGRGLATLSNWHTPVFRIAARDDDAREGVCHQALGSVRGAVGGFPLREDDPAVAALATARGRVVVVERCAVSPAIEIEGDFDGWLRTLSKNRVKDLRRRRRRLEEAHATRFFALETPVDLGAELDAGLRVEAEGWKGRAGTAIAARPDTEHFYRSLARRTHDAGALRFTGLEIDGELAAFEYMLVHGERVWVLKGGYDERHRDFAPGLLVQTAAIERAFELGMRSYELLGDDEPWKRSLANAERRTVRVRSYPATVTGRAAHAGVRHGLPLLRDLRSGVRGRIGARGR